MVTGRFLWDKIQYAVFVIVVAAAVLTPSPDPWNLIVLAAPMLAMYLLSIVVAWLAAPRGRTTTPISPQLRLVVAASSRPGASTRDDLSHVRLKPDPRNRVNQSVSNR